MVTTETWKSHMELAFHACVVLACFPRLLLLAAVRRSGGWMSPWCGSAQPLYAGFDLLLHHYVSLINCLVAIICH